MRTKKVEIFYIPSLENEKDISIQVGALLSFL